jgi:2-(1,2-epoxy-1,2-dihydrophenyl)acetyl-CoA isomerase
MGHVDLTVEEGVGWITFDRPDHFNSFDVETAEEFRETAARLAGDDDVRCAVVAATGDAFCSGADLQYVHEAGEEGYGAAFEGMLEHVHDAIAEIRAAPKPFLAAVDGIAAAGGFGIAMCCDLVYASTDAAFEWAYPRTGLTGAESSTFVLPRLVGFRTAMELMLRSPRLSPGEAAEMNLINDVFEAEAFDQFVEQQLQWRPAARNRRPPISDC